jgi:hypothetical protein
LKYSRFNYDVAHRVFAMIDEVTGEHLEPQLLRMGFLELRKPCHLERIARWQRFLLSGEARPSDPDYLPNGSSE